MDTAYIKSLHIIFVVTWFAGLFYIVRLFIYQTEAKNKEEPKSTILVEQFRLMQKRLWYGITWPSAILTLIFGWWMYFSNLNYYLTQPWMHLKLFFVSCLFGYHLLCHSLFVQLKKGIYKHSSLRLRIWNEVATLLLVVIVFLVVVKSSSGWIWGSLGLLAFTGILLVGIFVYKKQRDKTSLEQKNEEDQKSSPPLS